MWTTFRLLTPSGEVAIAIVHKDEAARVEQTIAEKLKFRFTPIRPDVLLSHSRTALESGCVSYYCHD